VVVLAVLCWPIGWFLGLFQVSTRGMPGPVIRQHAAWESSCQACHAPFHSLSSVAVDRRCQSCHSGADHHSSQIASEVSACAECHRDHRGREASLVRMDDRMCTRCHENLAAHRTADSGIAVSVTGFTADRHPPFGVVKSPKGDPGQLNFNHELHLRKGLARQPGGAPFVFNQVPPAGRKRLGLKPGMDANSPVQLACGSCHQLDGEEYGENRDPSSRTVIPVRTSGALMLPVTYEDHCQACHPLHFDSKVPARQVRHGQEPSGVLEELRSFYAGEALKNHPELLHRSFPRRPKPGEPIDPVVERVGKAMDDKVLTAVRMLFGSARKGCVECHQLAPQPKALVTADAIGNTAIVAVNVRELWFRHARFDHSSHRAVNCEECHEKAGGSSKTRDLLLPGIETCQQCHGPKEAPTRSAGFRGGVDHSCVECHRYHDGDHPRQGAGASVFAPKTLSRIRQFLQGVPEPIGP
jgi:predicted CXXCH cytochrome family protein